MIRIENDYKVNQNHHFSNEMTSDLVQEMVNGKLIWIVYLFAANAVTPLRVMEFDSCDLAEDWAVVQGSKLHTYFGLGLADDCGNCTDDKLCEKHYPFDNDDMRAAPGQTTKCRTHQEKTDDQHYQEMRAFFNENLLELDFKPHLPFCSQCGSDKAPYIGMLRYKQDSAPLTFGFCIPCRDELVRRADITRQSPERFGV